MARQILGSCVVLPDPVSPATTTTGCSAMAAAISRTWAEIGSSSGSASRGGPVVADRHADRTSAPTGRGGGATDGIGLVGRCARVNTVPMETSATRLARRAPARALLAALACASCAAPVPGAEPGGEEVGESAAAITAAGAIANAEQWVLGAAPLLPEPQPRVDTIDPACPAVCNRTDNAAWNPYRSDCSGLVSWAWGLPPPGRTTYGFAPFATDITQAIAASALAPGDAINNSDHVMLFKAWVTQGQEATFIEEPGCSVTPNYAHELTSSVSINGTQITVAYNGDDVHCDPLPGARAELHERVQRDGAGRGGGDAHRLRLLDRRFGG